MNKSSAPKNLEIALCYTNLKSNVTAYPVSNQSFCWPSGTDTTMNNANKMNKLYSGCWPCFLHILTHTYVHMCNCWPSRAVLSMQVRPFQHLFSFFYRGFRFTGGSSAIQWSCDQLKLISFAKIHELLRDILGPNVCAETYLEHHSR